MKYLKGDWGFLTIQAILGVFVGAGIIVAIHKSTQEPVPPIEQHIWCYIKTIQPGDSFGDNKAGNVEYSLIYTHSGIDVFKRCELMK